jgi:hypothetical protein
MLSPEPQKRPNSRIEVFWRDIVLPVLYLVDYINQIKKDIKKDTRTSQPDVPRKFVRCPSGTAQEDWVGRTLVRAMEDIPYVRTHVLLDVPRVKRNVLNTLTRQGGHLPQKTPHATIGPS